MRKNSWRHGRFVVVFAGLLSLVAVAAVAEEAAAPEPEPACAAALVPPAVAVTPLPTITPLAEGCGPCQANGTTATTWGMGVDCTAANNNLNSTLHGLGADACVNLGRLPCGITNIVIVTECIFYQGSYRVDGYATFKCRVCD